MARAKAIMLLAFGFIKAPPVGIDFLGVFYCLKFPLAQEKVVANYFPIVKRFLPTYATSTFTTARLTAGNDFVARAIHIAPNKEVSIER
jgi:hypothetical protein